MNRMCITQQINLQLDNAFLFDSVDTKNIEYIE